MQTVHVGGADCGKPEDLVKKSLPTKELKMSRYSQVCAVFALLVNGL